MDRRAIEVTDWTRIVALVTRVGAIAWTLLMLFVFWSPSLVREPVVWWADEAVHSGSFFGFAIAWRLARTRASRVAVAGVALAITTELVQPLLPWPRTAQIGDVVADACGVALGLAVVAAIARMRRRSP